MTTAGQAERRSPDDVGRVTAPASVRRDQAEQLPRTTGDRAKREPSRWKHLLFWVLVLSVPGWLLGKPYHLGLRATTAFLLGMPLPPRSPDDIEVDAAQVLWIFAAMCMAGIRTPLRQRLRAIAIGVPTLIAIELLTGILAIRTEMLAQMGMGLPASLVRFQDEILTSPPWLSAPILWLLLLGGRELPRDLMRGRIRRDPGPASGQRPRSGPHRRSVTGRPRGA